MISQDICLFLPALPYDNFLVHLCCCQYHYFFCFLTEWYSSLQMYHVVFIFLSLDILMSSMSWLVNSATLKIGVHVSFQMMNFSRSKAGKGLQDHMIHLCLVFQRTSLLFSIVASPFTFPPRLQEDSLFCTSSAVLFFVDLFDDGHCDQCEVITSLQFGIDLIIADVEYLSLCFYCFMPYEYNSPLETWPYMEFFSHYLPQDIS